MENKLFTEEELESLRGGLNESPIKSEKDRDDEGDGGGPICCVLNSEEALK